MEAPSPPDPVVLAVSSCLHSRSGPVVEEGVGVFQNPLTGKYLACNSISFVDRSLASRILQFGSKTTENEFLDSESNIGTLQLEHFEANYPSDSVELAVSSHRISRPGPQVRSGDGVLLPVISDPETNNRYSFDYFCKLISFIPGRTSLRTSEASDPPITVVPLLPAFSSRPGPVFGSGEGVFQFATSGKYVLSNSNYVPDTSVVSSQPLHARLSPYEAIVPAPGCTPASLMEAPNPLSIVESLPSALSSHPGPVYEDGEGVFQTVIAGKYTHVWNTSPPVMPIASSLHTSNGFHSDIGAIEAAESSLTVAAAPDIISSSMPPSPVAPSAANRTTDRMFSVYYQNVRGLRTKIAQLRLLLSSCDYEVLVFTETWLRADIDSSEISSDYVFFRCDRNELTSPHLRGGGVLIAAKNYLECESISIANCDNLEQIAVCIKSQSHSLYVVAIYLPPNSSAELYIAHARAVQQVADRLSETDIILSIGDFNLPNLRWHLDEDIDGFIPSNALTDTERNFTEAMFSNGLRQINNIVNTNERLLDLAFTNLPEYLDLIAAPASLLTVDNHHTPIILLLDESVVPSVLDDQDKCFKFDYLACDFDLLNSIFMNIEWEQLSSYASVDQMLSAFYESLSEVMNHHVPRKRQAPISAFNKPWWTAELRTLRNKLRKLRNRFFQTKNESDKARLVELELEYKATLSATHENYLCRIQTTVKENPSRFWDFIKKRKADCGIPGSVNFEGTTSRSCSETANLFANFFESVFSKASPVQRQAGFEQIPSHNIHLQCIQFSPDEVQKALENLDSTKGPGTDCLPPVLLKNCAATLASPIAAIFNRSLQDRTFPNAWKTASIVPIHKSGNKKCVTNYRGISILCTLSKMLEKLIHTALYRVTAPIISNSQHGFMNHRSTTSNLMCYVSAISRDIASKQQVDSVYVDFAKAFDTVPHNLIISKMNHIGFPTWITEWLNSYLSDRNAFVVVNSVRSRTFDTPSGVPQGSVLGPLIFIIYVNDLCELLSSSKLSYADDLKFFRVIVSPADCVAVQEDINRLLVWCGDNGMRVNSKKCKVISFTRSNSVTLHPYCMGPDSLERVNSICDLGVTIDSRLTFCEHISIVTAKAYTVLGFIRRHASGFTDVYCLKTLFCSLVRSIVEYASPVWSPFYTTQILTIERIQKSFMRFALRQLPWNDPVILPSYPDRCMLIDLESLSARRIKLQRLFIFDLITGNVDCPELLERIPWNIPPRRFRNSSLLAIPFHRTNFGFNICFNSCLRSFNDVCNEFDFTMSKNVFSNRIRGLD